MTLDRAGVGSCERFLLSIALLSALSAGCTNFKKFKPYVPTIDHLTGAESYRVKLNVWNAPEEFTLYNKKSNPQRYATSIKDYVTDALQQEFAKAGFGKAAKPGGTRTVLVDVYVNQFDLGYDKLWWTTGVAFIGYSRVNTIALADVTVEVVLPGSDERYRRRFVSRADDSSKLLWFGFFLPIIPIPISGFYDEEAQIHEAATECFRRVVTSVDELVKAYAT